MKTIIIALLLSLSAWAANYDVKAFGAKGDGSTNDTTAIQAAITAAQASGAGLTGNSGDVVWFPQGIYICGALTGSGSRNLTIRGTGRSTQIRPTSSSETWLAVTTGSGFFTNVDIADITLDWAGAGFTGITTGYGIKLTSMVDPHIKNVTFFNVMNAIYLDRVSQAWIADIMLLDNSTIYVGSSVDGALGYSWDDTLIGVKHQTTNGGPPSLNYTGAILQLERAVSTHVIGFIAHDLINVAKGISIRNDSQSVTIIGGTIEDATSGIELVQNTVGSTTTKPLQTYIGGGMNIDAFNSFGIVATAGNYTHIDNVILSNGKSGVLQAIYVGGNNTSPTIRNCAFQAGAWSGNAIAMDGGVSGFAIENNHFDLQLTGGGTDLYIVTSGSSHYIITGNIRDAGDTSVSAIADFGSAPKTVTNNQF